MALLTGRLGLSPGDQGWLQPFGASASVTWTSSDPVVASVDAQGRVTALAAGSTTIRAQAGSQSAAAAVRVHAAGAATAGALIATALAQGSISAEQALIYRVYARFGDSRLPAAFDGAPATTSSHGLMREVAGAPSNAAGRRLSPKRA